MVERQQLQMYHQAMSQRHIKVKEILFILKSEEMRRTRENLTSRFRI